MSNVFTLVGKSWDFKKSQPVLRPVLFWLLFIPMSALLLMETYLETNQPSPDLIVGIGFLHIVVIALLLWGVACVTLVGKRLLKSKAGRARSSFATVRKQAARSVVNLFFTDILRGCITILWSLLLIIPGIIYQIRTYFYFVAIVCEGKGYREALQHSKKTVKGQTWAALKGIVGLFFVIFIPLLVMDTVLTGALYTFEPKLLQATYLITAYLYSFGIVLLLLSSISLYAELKRSSSKK